ncbi:MAG: N-acetylmuramoyl-L-alanine amidase [Eudoraea sp.]|nr:N-acetylmuramoyl-L-alanine amidase [Eudoraea sp.]MBT8211316.1 N-acetylmuramoyl-L-alanine amidase [Eudoraea sp.]NNK29537.1 N-acetylmuramoyl-L-alanine amidase [Flavobacteriaceae bacterium]
MLGKWFVIIPFLLGFEIAVPVQSTQSNPFVKDKFVVVLDAGHGGHDPGNLGNGYLEKNIALRIVLEAGKILEKNPDIEVVYTRKDDTFVDLYVRGEIANKAKADLFVSVHCDSHTSDANGAGTFVLGLHANKQNFEIAKKENSVIYLEDNYESRYAEYDINSPESVIGLTIMQEEFLDQSIMLAKIMQEKFTRNLKRNDRKVKQAGFIVLHQTFMPSVLIESGFLTNKNEGSYLNSRRGQSEMGKAIAEAILNYKEALQYNYSEAAPPEDPVITPPPTKIEETVVQNEDIKSTEKELTAEVEVAEKEAEKPVEVKPDTAKELQTPVTLENKETPKEAVAASDKEEVAVIQKEEPTQAEESPVEKVKEEVGKTAKEPVAKANIVFKVQLMASSKDLPLRSEDFKGLSALSKEPYKNLYRYFYGSTNSYFQAKLFKSNADAKGYTTSFIVAYKDGVRIPLNEALKYEAQ